MLAQCSSAHKFLGSKSLYISQFLHLYRQNTQTYLQLTLHTYIGTRILGSYVYLQTPNIRINIYIYNTTPIAYRIHTVCKLALEWTRGATRIACARPYIYSPAGNCHTSSFVINTAFMCLEISRQTFFSNKFRDKQVTEAHS